MGQKDYLYKNSLWQEATRVPLVIRAPGMAAAAGVCKHPVSLIDIYPTLIDTCGLTGETKKNDKGHSLDGHSLTPFLTEPRGRDQWTGPDAVLTALYKWRMKYASDRGKLFTAYARLAVHSLRERKGGALSHRR